MKDNGIQLALLSAALLAAAATASSRRRKLRGARATWSGEIPVRRTETNIYVTTVDTEVDVDDELDEDGRSGQATTFGYENVGAFINVTPEEEIGWELVDSSNEYDFDMGNLEETEPPPYRLRRTLRGLR